MGTAGIGATVGSHACAAALEACGGVRRLAVLSPYWPAMNTEVARYFGDMGFTVVRDMALRCRSWTGTARIPPAECRDALRRPDGDDVDAIVRAGAELFSGKPVIAIDAAACWHAQRRNGIPERIASLGRLLEEF